ncbi:ABC transporter permease [bacterium]|nr:ABC transporter permease [bacterium]
MGNNLRPNVDRSEVLKPPVLAEWLLIRIADRSIRYSAVGDFEEQFHFLAQYDGVAKAKLWYWLQVIQSTPAFIADLIYWGVAMFKNYLKIAWRNLLKYKTYSTINVTGLAIGIAACLLITLFVIDELSYDRYHEKSPRIFRVTEKLAINDLIFDVASAPFPMMEALINDFPEIETGFRLFTPGDFPFLEQSDRKFKEEKFYFADPAIFNVLDIELVKGSRQTALNEPNSVVLTEASAWKYFESLDVLGKTLKYQGGPELEVTGVAKALPSNSHFTFDLLAPLQLQLDSWERQTGDNDREKKWIWTGAWNYILLKDRQMAATLREKFPYFVDRYFPERFKGGVELKLQPITDIHLYSRLSNEVQTNSHVVYVYIFSGIAFLILLIGCVNFMNLATALSMNRAREVGVRKVLGGHKSQLVSQYLGEATLSCFLALGLGVLLAELFLPAFNRITEKALNFSALYNLKGVLAVVGLGLLVGILSGIYPTLLLTRFQPTTILKGVFKPGRGRDLLRKSLVVLQFAVSIILMIGIGVIHQQLRFVQEKEIGFDKEQVLFVKARWPVTNKFETFRTELLQSPQIVSVSAATEIPGQGVSGWRFVPEGTSMDDPIFLPLSLIDYDYLKTLGISLKKGRQISRDSPSDKTQAFMINEKAAESLGWEGEAIGKSLKLFGAGTNEIWKSGQVVGVVKDYNFESLHHEVKPLVLAYGEESWWYAQYAIKIAPGNTKDAIEHIEKTWLAFSPNWPIEYVFLDQDLEQHYANDRKLGTVIRSFTSLAIFIACLGLFGLGSFTILKRTKEIGIRKVVGAGTSAILVLISKDFVKLMIIANLVAWPAAYFALNKWLQNFAYRTAIDWKVFLIAGVLAILIALLTTSYHAAKAALFKPVQLIRYE